jgi:hypothetical protein
VLVIGAVAGLDVRSVESFASHWALA